MTRIVLILSLVAASAGCGSTQIRTENGAKIYVAGRLVGKGQGSIRKRGGPHSVTITVKTEDGRTARTKIRRSFDGWTALSCPFTYLIGCFANWSYPESVYVDLPPRREAPSTPGWSNGNDVWNRPPPGWNPSGDPTPKPAARPDDNKWADPAPSDGDSAPAATPTQDPDADPPAAGGGWDSPPQR